MQWSAESLPLSSFWVASGLPAKTKLPTRTSHAGLCVHSHPRPLLPLQQPGCPLPLSVLPHSSGWASPIALQTLAQEAVQGLLGKGLPQTLLVLHSQPDTQVGDTCSPKHLPQVPLPSFRGQSAGL